MRHTNRKLTVFNERNGEYRVVSVPPHVTEDDVFAILFAADCVVSDLNWEYE